MMIRQKPDICTILLTINTKTMKTINPKCSNINSFICSIIISLHYHELIPHPERYSKFEKYFSKYDFFRDDFEKNNTNEKANIIKINNRYHALKPTKDKYTKLNNLFK